MLHPSVETNKHQRDALRENIQDIAQNMTVQADGL